MGGDGQWGIPPRTLMMAGLQRTRMEGRVGARAAWGSGASEGVGAAGSGTGDSRTGREDVGTGVDGGWRLSQ